MSIKETPGRIPFEWIEIDMPKCALTYGVSACQADVNVTGDGTSSSKCYNTRATCQDPDNYDGSDTLTLYFCKAQSEIPKDQQYEPFLQNVTVSATKLNPAGANKSSTALGSRAVLKVTMTDHPHDDTIVDPYIATDRSFDPYERSTFWAKWKARNLYYIHKEIRHKSGYIDPATNTVDSATLITRTFFITGFDGPTSDGIVSIEAKDILTLAANEKAKAPSPSQAKLQADITDSDTTIYLKPTGAADEYNFPLSGVVRIGRELIEFTRSTGDDTLIVPTGGRGVKGTTAESHSTDDTVQPCLIYTSDTVDTILTDLLTNTDYGANIDASLLDDWSDEITNHLSDLYSATISEPTGIIQLISEMCEQMFFVLWWDDRASRLKLRAVRGPDTENTTDLNDTSNNLKGSIKWRDLYGQLITQVWIYYAQIDPTEKLNEPKNYQVLDIFVAPDGEEGTDKYDQQRIKTIFSRWHTQLAAGSVQTLGNSILNRYKKVPREVMFKLDAKDGDLWIADYIHMQNRNIVDSFGNQSALPMQITSAQESIQGTTFSYSALEFPFPFEAEQGETTLIISADTLNLHLRDYWDSVKGVPPSSGEVIHFVVRAGVTIGGVAGTASTNLNPVTDTLPDSTYTGTMVVEWPSEDTKEVSITYLQRRLISSNRSFTLGDTYTEEDDGSSYGTLKADIEERPLSVALDTGIAGVDWPTDVTLKLTIEAGAYIYGEGGNSSLGYVDDATSGKMIRGGDGGHAICVRAPITINNLGTIGAGGGAGCSFAYGFTDAGSDKNFYMFTGGGGGGYFLSSIIGGYFFENEVEQTIPGGILSSLASQGSKTLGGNGAVSTPGITYAGDGGDLAQNGETARFFATDYSRFGYAGNAINCGSDLITWENQGNIIGTIVGEVTRDSVLALGPIAMWDTSLVSSVTIDASNNVSQIDDLSGNNYHLEQSTGASQPVYTNNSLVKYVTLDGTDDYMSVISNKSFLNAVHEGTGATVFVMCSPDNASGNAILANVGATTTQGHVLNIDNTTNDRMTAIIYRGVSGTSAISHSMAVDSFEVGETHVVAWTVKDQTGDDSTLYLDDVEDSTDEKNNSYPTGDATYDLDMGRFSVLGNYFGGRFMAAAYFDRVLTTSEINTVNTYLTSLYENIAGFDSYYPFENDLGDLATTNTVTHTRSTVALVIYEDESLNYLSVNTPAFPGSGLLFEKAATNKVLYSRDLSTGWGTANCTQASGKADPLGGTNGGSITSTGTNAVRIQSPNMSLNANKHFGGCFLRSLGTNDWVILQTQNSGTGNGRNYWFNVSTGETGTTIKTAGATAYNYDDYGVIPVKAPNGDQWYYCYFDYTRGAAETNTFFRIYSANGDGVFTADNGQELLYYQCDNKEEDALSSPIIVTGGTTATRTINWATFDNSTMPANDFSVYATVKMNGPIGSTVACLMDTRDATDGIRIYLDGATNEWVLQRRVSSVSYESRVSVSAPTRNTEYVIQCDLSSTDGNLITVNGVAGNQEATGTGNITHNENHLGTFFNLGANTSLRGQIKNLRWLPL